MKPHIGVLHSRIRQEEKWIFAAFDRLGLEVDRIDDRRVSLDLDRPDPWREYDAI